MSELDFKVSDLGTYTLTAPAYPRAMELWTEARESNWEHWEINYSQDISQIASGCIAPHDFETILFPILFFVAEEGIVGENCTVLYSLIQSSEYRLLFAQQLATEAMHSVAYQNMFEVLVPDADERHIRMGMFMSKSSIQGKRDWAIRWKDAEGISIQQRLFAFACVEGVHFSSSFAILGWSNNGRPDPIFPGIYQANEQIRADENSHVVGYGAAHSDLCKERLNEEIAYQMMRECVDAELASTEDAVHEGVVGLTKADLKKFVMYMGDYVLSLFGHKFLYNVDNPFPWMGIRGLTQRISFFETDTRNYFRTGTGAMIDVDSYVPSENF